VRGLLLGQFTDICCQTHVVEYPMSIIYDWAFRGTTKLVTIDKHVGEDQGLVLGDCIRRVMMVKKYLLD
jgi:hypothetical protein